MYEPLINKVLESDMCIGCGACIESCPKKNVVPACSLERGAHEVSIVEDCEGCQKECEAVCPSIEVNYQQLPINNQETSKLWGIENKSVWIGYSKRYQNSANSSSGGIIRELIRTSLEKGKEVICLAKSENSYEVSLMREFDDMNRLPGSIYHSVGFYEAIPRIKESQGKVVVVGIPCQIEGVQQYISKIDPGLANKVDLYVGIVCGWMFSFHSIKSFASYKDINRVVVNAEYRGDTEAGKLKLYDEQGEIGSFDRRIFESEEDRIKYRASFGTPANRERCRVCVNHTNCSSDISLGDAWLQRKKGYKESICIVRTEKAEKLVDELIASRQIVVEPGSSEDIIESQSYELAAGVSGYSLGEKRRNDGLFTPEFNQRYEGMEMGWWEKSLHSKEKQLRSLLRRSDYMSYLSAYEAYIKRKELKKKISYYIKRLKEKVCS